MRVEGFFGNLKVANNTVQRLKSSGFDKAFIDANSHYVDERDTQINLPGTETSPSLSALILQSGSHVVDRSKAPLTAANPMTSGIGTFDEIADVKCKVIVETEEASGDKAKQIIKDGGGELSNLNIIKPRMEDGRDITIYNALDEIRRDT